MIAQEEEEQERDQQQQGQQEQEQEQEQEGWHESRERDRISPPVEGEEIVPPVRLRAQSWAVRERYAQLSSCVRVHQTLVGIVDLMNALIW